LGLPAIASYTFVNSAARLVLSDIVGVPEDELGTAAGDLGFYSEILIIVAVTPWGVLSDKARTETETETHRERYTETQRQRETEGLTRA
jgi:hypothetical protein